MKNQDIPSSISDIQVIKVKGPWNSKSGGLLNVGFALPREALTAFLDYDNPEFTAIKERSGVDIHGLRLYTVKKIPKGSIGAKEWHKARSECVSVLAGKALWQCVDLHGKKREFVLDDSISVIVPPCILHTYQALEDDTHIQVICNTLFNPEEPSTHDTYSYESFYDAIRS